MVRAKFRNMWFSTVLTFLILRKTDASPGKITLHYSKFPAATTAKLSGSVTLNCKIYDEKRSLDYDWYIKSNTLREKNFRKIKQEGDSKHHISSITSLPHKAATLLKQNNPDQIFGSSLKITFLTALNNDDEILCVARDPRAVDEQTRESVKVAETSTVMKVGFRPSGTDSPVAKARDEYICRRYQGSQCSDFFSEHFNVKLNMHQTVDDVEQEVEMILNAFKDSFLKTQKNLKKSGKSDSHKGCDFNAIRAATCNYVYEVCPLDRPENPENAMRLCREDCELLTLSTCKPAFDEFKKVIENMGNAMMINCTQLKPRGQQCLPTGIKKWTNDTQRCYDTKLQRTNSILDSVTSDTQTEYFGVASSANNGLECLKWDNNKLLQNYPKELAGGHNFCRSINPAGMTRGVPIGFDWHTPWCFTENHNKSNRARKIPVYCDIQACSFTSTINQNLPVILMVSAGAILLLIVVAACICCGKFGGKNNKGIMGKLENTHQDATVASSFIHQPVNHGVSQNHGIPNHPGMNSGMNSGINSGMNSGLNHSGMKVPNGLMYGHDSSGSHSSHHILQNQQNSTISSSAGLQSLAEIQPETIDKMCEIGDGNFGKVHLAKIAPIHPTYQPKQPVLVKTLDANDQVLDESTEQEFIRELNNRAELRHVNLICLKAFVKQPRICCLVYEYTEWSTLHKTLVASRLGVGAAGVPTHLSVENFPYIIRQIADVMSYLEDKGYTHRDLAARNIMIMNGEFHVKIASLGMMRRDYMTDYAKLNWLQQMPFAMPLRWMSPESLQYGKFSIASDVWSFGIVLWEMFALGNRPWAEFSNDQVIELVAQRGQTLPRPPDCSDNVFSIMKECWNTSPEGRPSFADLKNRFLADRSVFEGVSQNMSGINQGSHGASHNGASHNGNSQHGGISQHNPQHTPNDNNRNSFRQISNSLPQSLPQTPASNVLNTPSFPPNTPNYPNSPTFQNSQNFNNSNNFNNANQPLLQQSSPSSNYVEPAPSSHYTNITHSQNQNKINQYQAPAPSHNGLLSYHTLSDGERDIQI